MIDKCEVLNAKTRNKGYIAEISAKLIRYYSDPDKKGRLAAGLCKYCAYVGTSRAGGSAITHHKCDNCGEEMTFASTCIDRLCKRCAAETSHCKHCLQKLD